MSRNIFKLGALEAQKTAFLICDIQELFRPHIKHFSEVVKVANKMELSIHKREEVVYVADIIYQNIEAAKLLKIPVYVSEQYPRGLGHTTKDINLDDVAMIYGKLMFSMLTPELQERLKKDVPCLSSVVLFGMATHVCIEQTVTDLLKEDITVHILADGVSSETLMDRRLALQRFQSLGCFVATSENILFKLIKGRDHSMFKQISKLNLNATPDKFGIKIEEEHSH